MQAMMRHYGPPEAGRPVRGTFYPSELSGGAGVSSALPKILAVLVGVIALRTIARAAGRAHGAQSRWSRRREAIAELHRELHAQDAGGQPAADAPRA